MSKLLTTLAAGAVVALLAVPVPASAANASGPRGDGMKSSNSIEVSSAKRHRAHRQHRHVRRHVHRHHRWHGYYGRPYYGPRYYSGGPYYAASPYYHRPYYYRPGPGFYFGPFGFGMGW